jgi:hypothetical protein
VWSCFTLLPVRTMQYVSMRYSGQEIERNLARPTEVTPHCKILGSQSHVVEDSGLLRYHAESIDKQLATFRR